MAFDLVVGKSPHIKDNPLILDGILFEQTPMIERLYKKYGGAILMHLSNPFSDFKMDSETLKTCKNQCYQLLKNNELSTEERSFILRITAIICFTIDSGLLLHGVAD